MNDVANWDAERVAAETRLNPVERLADTLFDRLLSHADSRIVFGEAVTQGDYTVVPVAKVSTRFGLGGGSGSGPNNAGSGGGGGGGGDLRARPLGYIELTPSFSQFVSINDDTQLGLRALTMVGIVGAIIAWRLGRGGNGGRGGNREQGTGNSGESKARKLRLRLRR